MEARGTLGERERVVAAGARVPAGAEGHVGEVDKDLPTVGVDPPGRSHRQRLAGDQCGGRVTCLDEDADQVRRVVIPAAAAGVDQPRHRGIGLGSDLRVRLVAEGDSPYLARHRPGQAERVRQRGDVAELLETLGASSSNVMPLPPAPRAPANLAWARSCYDHLAGEIAVAIFDRLLADEHLAEVDHGLVITPTGVERFASLGVDVAAMTSAGRPVARACLDWTERKHHLGGAAGRALFDAFQSSGWIRRGRQPRTIHLTDAGSKALHESFGCNPLPGRH